MHRFWVFPLVLGVAGALYPVLCVVEYLSSAYYSTPVLRGIWLDVLSDGVDTVFRISSPYGFAIGLLMGLVAAVGEMARFGVRDRSGMQAAQRLIGNLWWLGCYALGLCVGTFSLGLAAVNLGLVTVLVFRGSVSAAFAIGLLFVNFAAVLWATIRTARAEDVLSPRVLADKWRASNRVIE